MGCCGFFPGWMPDDLRERWIEREREGYIYIYIYIYMYVGFRPFNGVGEVAVVALVRLGPLHLVGAPAALHL